MYREEGMKTDGWTDREIQFYSTLSASDEGPVIITLQ